MTVSVKVRNKDRILQNLRETVPAIQAALEKANGEAAREMVSIAQHLAPFASGDLRASIVATPPGGVPPPYSQGIGGPVPEGAWMVTAGNAKVRYAHLVEFGARPHIAGGIFAGAQHPGAPRQPFFWPSYRLIRRKQRNRVGRAMSKAIKEAVT